METSPFENVRGGVEIYPALVTIAIAVPRAKISRSHRLECSAKMVLKDIDPV